MGGKKQKQKTEPGKSSDLAPDPLTGLSFQEEGRQLGNPPFLGAAGSGCSVVSATKNQEYFPFSLPGKYKKATPQMRLVVFIKKQYGT